MCVLSKSCVLKQINRKFLRSSMNIDAISWEIHEFLKFLIETSSVKIHVCTYFTYKLKKSVKILAENSIKFLPYNNVAGIKEVCNGGVACSLR